MFTITEKINNGYINMINVADEVIKLTFFKPG